MGVLLFLRLLALLMLARLGGRFLANVIQGYRGEGRVPRNGDLVRDRVCNTFLPRERALSAFVGGHEEHFCSVACRDQAKADTHETP